MPSEAEPAFGDVLRRYRVAAGLTQEALAERAGVSARAVSSLESGARRAPYRETVRLLADALGLGDAEREVLAAAALRPRVIARSIPARSQPEQAAIAPSALPAALTSFVGRDDEVAALAHIVRDPAVRLVTLTGAGGCGKTRLALEVARTVAPSFTDGLHLLDLAPVAEPALVPQALAAALDVRETPGVTLTVSVQRALTGRRLLVLDTCEHVINACAELVECLLGACPGLTVLATSREPLRVPGERQWWVPPLPAPGAGTPASPDTLAAIESVALFVERARARRPDFTLTDRNAAAVAQMCTQLDGLPLAIELAAARVGVMSAEDMAARLDDRFRLLNLGSRTAQPRQQTLRAAIDWSYDLLSLPERTVFNRLSVFASAFPLDAAEAVCAGSDIAFGDVLDLLGRLVEKSLVVAESQQGAARYRLLETVRRYGAERLAEADDAAATHQRHLDWYRSLAERAEPYLSGPDQQQWITLLDRDRDNLQAAMNWSRSGGEPEAGLRLAAALWRFWSIRGYLSAGRLRLNQLLHAATAQGGVAPEVCARALNAAGVLARQHGAYEEAAAYWEAAIAVWRERGDLSGVAAATNNLGALASDQGEAEQAARLHAECLALWQELGDQWGIATALSNLALSAHAQGDTLRAVALLEESLQLRRTLGDTERIAESLNILGRVVRGAGDLARAEALHAESLRLRWEVHDTIRLPYCLEGLAAVAVLRHEWPRAARLYGAAEALRIATGSPLPPAQRTDYDRSTAALRAGLASDACAAFRSEGAAMPLEEVVALALREPEAGSRAAP